MSTSFDAAIRELSQCLPGFNAREHLRRAEARKDGTLVATTTHGGGPRWFKKSDSATPWVEVQPGDDAKIPASGRAVAPGAELIGWRPGRRIVWRETRGDRALVVKGYRKGRVAVAGDRLSLAARGSQDVGAFRIPTPHDVRLQDDSIELELLPGQAPELTARGTDIHFRIGCALRLLQDATPTEGLQAHAVDDEIASIETLRDRCAPWAELPAGWAAAFAALERIRDAAGDVRLLPCHRDFYEAQVLVSEQGLGLVDFDLFALADPALDVANYTAHLQLRALQGVNEATQQQAELASAALLDGLDRDAEPAFGVSLRFYQAATFLRLAVLYSIRPRWPEVPSLLVRCSMSCLDDLR